MGPDQRGKRRARPSAMLLTDVEAPDDRMLLMLFAMEGFSATQRTFMLLVCRKGQGETDDPTDTGHAAREKRCSVGVSARVIRGKGRARLCNWQKYERLRHYRCRM